MANRTYIVPQRLDIDRSLLYVYDLLPNGSQKNNNLDGEGQSHYLKHSQDRPGATVVSGNSYLSGNLTTSPLSGTTVADIEGGGNDSSVTDSADFGLLAYLRDRVHVNPGGDSDFMIQAEALAVVDDLNARVLAGQSLTLSDINTVLNTNLTGADTDLDGSVSDSFGSVQDILRILCGEVYRVNGNTVVGDELGAFADQATRASRVSNNATANAVFASGAFLTETDSGFRDLPQLALTEAVRLSARGGQLRGYLNSLTLLNPSFAYTAADVTAATPRAFDIGGTAIPSTGSFPVVTVYDQDGNLIV